MIIMTTKEDYEAKRNQLNQETLEVKAKRDQINAEIKEKSVILKEIKQKKFRKEIKELNELRKTKKELEKIQMTKVLSVENEKNIVSKISKTNKKINEIKDKIRNDEDIQDLSLELKLLRDHAKEYHDEVLRLSAEATKYHKKLEGYNE